MLAGGFVAGLGGGAGDGGVDAVEQRFARGAAEIEGTCFHEVFEHAFVDRAAIYALDHVGEVGERAVLLAFLDDFLRGEFAHALHTGEAETDFVADGSEHLARFVHVGAEDGEAHRFALGDEVGNFFGVAQLGAEHGGHELHGVVGLQKTGLVAEDGIGGGVGFVETVAGEFVEDIEDRVGGFRLDGVHAFRALDEFRALGRHRLFVLFAHRAAQHVGAAERVAGDDLGGLHHLFLIDHDAVGFAADFLEELVGKLDGARIFFSAHIVGNPLHRAGAVERDERDDLVDRGEADLAAEILHAAGLQLKHAGGAAGIQEGKRLRVLERDRLDVELRIGGAADVVHGVGDDGERLEPEEIHLQQTELRHGIHVVLHGDVAFLLGERDELLERAVGDDDAGGVLAGVAHHALEDERLVEDSFRERIFRDLVAQLGGFFERDFERHVELVGNHLREAVGVAVGEAVDARDVADDHLRAERAVGDDVGHAVVAVFLANVVDDLAAAPHAEVDVEVRRRYAFGIQEALEEKFEPQRVEIGDPEEIRDDATGAGTAAGADGDVLFPRPVDEIPHDEEVVDETGFADDAEFEVEALDEDFCLSRVGRAFGRRVVHTVAFFQAGDAEVPEVAAAVGLRGNLGRERVFRVALAALGKRDREVAHLGDELRVRHRLGHLGEELRHLVARL